MHPYFFSQLYRERLAEFERQAKYRRQFRKQESRRFARLVSFLTRSRRPAPPVAAEAQPCR